MTIRPVDWIACFVFAAGCFGSEVIVAGTKVDDLKKVMSARGDGSVNMAIESSKGKLMFSWMIGDGALIVEADERTQLVTSLEYILQDERPKSVRRTFRLKVKDFNPSTGIMTIRINENK
jgi:hypothetical protein